MYSAAHHHSTKALTKSLVDVYNFWLCEDKNSSAWALQSLVDIKRKHKPEFSSKSLASDVLKTLEYHFIILAEELHYELLN